MKRAYIWITALFLCVGTLAGCASSEKVEIGKPDDNRQVKVNNYDYFIVGRVGVTAFCDGTTRVYVKGNGLSSVVNSPECVGDSQ